MWTSRIPSLSHLCEIGCRAFALIQTNNPKIYHHSHPCILIGYAPHAKAYHLWDTIDGSIFNSFHVTFLEHLDEQPVDLLPGTTVCIEPNATPSWDAPSCPFISPSTPSPTVTPNPPDLNTSTTTLHSPSDGKNHQILTPSSSSLTTAPGKNHPLLTPGALSDTSSSPSVHQSS